MTTQLIKYIERLRQADQLIRMESTGRPRHFAEKLCVSESSLYGVLDEMRSIGLPLAYDRQRETYYYNTPVSFQVELRVDKRG